MLTDEELRRMIDTEPLSYQNSAGATVEFKAIYNVQSLLTQRAEMARELLRHRLERYGNQKHALPHDTAEAYIAVGVQKERERCAGIAEKQTSDAENLCSNPDECGCGEWYRAWGACAKTIAKEIRSGEGKESHEPECAKTMISNREDCTCPLGWEQAKEQGE